MIVVIAVIVTIILMVSKSDALGVSITWQKVTFYHWYEMPSGKHNYVMLWDENLLVFQPRKFTAGLYNVIS